MCSSRFCNPWDRTGSRTRSWPWKLGETGLLCRIQSSPCCHIWSCQPTTRSAPGTFWCGACTRTWPQRPTAARPTFPAVLVPVGARTVRALALVAEVVHGAPCRFTDPARFAFAHGGKDRHPFPVPVRVYDETLRVLKSAVRNAKLGRDEELGALKRLDDQARRLEDAAPGPSVESLIVQERQRSPTYGGRSVFGWEAVSHDRVKQTE